MAKAAVFGVVKNDKPDINERYFEHIRASGIDTVTAYPSPVSELAYSCDCLIVCGGGDMNPLRYGQKSYNGVYMFDDKFDGYELSLIKAFYDLEKPILGICRGMQSINIALGGTLIQDIPSMLGLCHSSEGDGECMHEIKISKDSKLYNALGLRAIVNSYHHQCVHKIAKELRVAAASHDGVIEAIEGINIPILGVQWHPERMTGNTVFDHFFNEYIK